MPTAPYMDTPERVMSPSSSDAGSLASSTVQGDDSRRDSLSGTPSRRLGSLQGAGLSSLSLSLGADPGFSAGTSLVGFNAISTLLNNPRRPQRPIDPNSSRFAPISQSHTDLPKVKRSDIDSTINGLRAEWDRFQRNQRLGVRGKARLAAEDEENELRVGGKKGRENGDAIGDDDEAESERRTTLDEDHDAPARALGKRRLPPLSTVPQVFFSEEFDLGNPYTFDLVTERYKAASAGSSSKFPSSPGGATRNGSSMTGYDVALNQMLQEKLSYYSDVVEQHLILEISARSTSFFAAFGNLKDLEAESRDCLDKVEELKRELDDRDEGIAKAGLRLVQEQAKRRETNERLEAVGLMHQLCEKRDLCQLLVQNNEWSEALDVMQSLGDIVQGKAKLVPRGNTIDALPPHVDLDLSNVAAVQALSPQLHEMRNNIAAQLEVELLSILIADLDERIGQPGEETAEASSIEPSIAAIQENGANADLQGLASPSAVAKPNPFTSAAPPARPEELQEDEQRLANKVAAHVKGLVRTGGMDRAIAAYKGAMVKMARKTMRTYLQEASVGSDAADAAWRESLATLLEDDEAATGKLDAKLGPGGVEAATKLQALDHEPFLRLLRTLLSGLTKCVKGTDAQRRVIVKLLDDEGRRGELADEVKESRSIDLLMPAGVSPSLPTTLAAVVSDVCGATHILASRLLSLRSSSHTGMPLKSFLAVFHLAWTFILQSEALCGRMIIGLRGVVLNQAKAWLAFFHKTRIEKAAKAVEEEQWAQAEVSAEQQRDIEVVIECATSDPSRFVIAKEAIQDEHISGEVSASEKADGAATKSKALIIEEKQFFIVSATLDVLDMLVDYLRVVINLPLLSTEIMGRIVEFLKQFNSRTCQVVLGAGAMRSAGLKNITAKHLALASQSLSIMIALIPYIREAVRRHLNARQAVMLVEFDKLKRDYQEHQYEIHAKLVAIMSDRLTVHCRGLAAVDWSAPLSDDGDEKAVAPPVKPMMDLVKETTTLHKVLCKCLQPSVVELVIGQVLLSIDTRVGAELRKIESHDEPTRKRVTAIRDHFNDKLGTLKHVDWTSKELDAAVEEVKRVPPPTPPKPSMDEIRPMSPAVSGGEAPATPPAYKPRVGLFARKQLQRQQQREQEQREREQKEREQQQEQGQAREEPKDGAQPAQPKEGEAQELDRVAEPAADDGSKDAISTSEPKKDAEQPREEPANEEQPKEEVTKDESIKKAEQTEDEVSEKEEQPKAESPNEDVPLKEDGPPKDAELPKEDVSKDDEPLTEVPTDAEPLKEEATKDAEQPTEGPSKQENTTEEQMSEIQTEEGEPQSATQPERLTEEQSGESIEEATKGVGAGAEPKVQEQASEEQASQEQSPQEGQIDAGDGVARAQADA